MKRTSTAIICVFAILICLSGCSKSSSGANDVAVAKSAFGLLVKGDPAVEEMIDWDHFQAMSMDVGKMYSSMPNDKEKAAFRKSFVASFSASYLKTGATAESLSNWRLQSQDANQTIVIADTKKKTTMSITVVNSNGTRKMAGMK